MNTSLAAPVTPYRRRFKLVSSNKKIFSQSDAQLEMRIRKIALYDT